MSILVTGASGFIGRHVVSVLQQQQRAVRVFDQPTHDITDAAAVQHAMHGVTGVIHLAAIASVPACTAQRSKTAAVNIMGTLHVFEEAARLNIPVVYASSAAVYGVPQAVPLAEDTPQSPTSGYGADKLANELHARTIGGLNAIGLRLFNVYGAGQSTNSVIGAFLNAIAQNKPLTLFGTGQQTRDFVHVEDVAQAFVYCLKQLELKNPMPLVCNIGTGEQISLKQLVEVLGGTQLHYAPAREGDIEHSVACIKRRLQYLPQVSFRTLAQGL